jgi:hypothetical protein
MACCDWDTFKDAFLSTWHKARHMPSELLIDWKRAQFNWKKHHCTGGEAATMQLNKLTKEGEYIWLESSRKRNDDDGGMAIDRIPLVL